jgi:formylmethanofuran dehydrogenase subunit E
MVCAECGIKIHYRQRYETKDKKRVCIMCWEEKYKRKEDRDYEIA